MTFFFSSGDDGLKTEIPMDDSFETTGDLSGGIDDMINDLEAEE